ncbi:MAG: patatin-like phospholipase family protein [Pseudomonadota bacterium]
MMTDFVLVGVAAEVFSINGLGTVVPVRVVEGEVKIGDQVFVYQPLPHSAAEDEKPRSVAKTSIVGFTPAASPPRTSAKKGEEVGIVLRGLRPSKALEFHFVGTQYVPRDGQPLNGPLFDRFDLFDKHKDNWRPSHAKKFGIGLQGGGLRGAFGVGAVRFLAELGLLDKANGQLEVLGSASTGSITSMVLMEKSGVTCVDKAIKEYTRLRTYEDMLTLRSEVKEEMKKTAAVSSLIPAILNEEVGMLDPEAIIEREIWGATTHAGWQTGVFIGVIVGAAGFATFGVGAAVAGAIVAAIGGAFVGGVFGADAELKEDAESLRRFFAIKPSIATLDPVEKELRRLVVGTDFRRNGIALRMAVNNMETGQTGYITERGKLLYPVREGPKDIFHPSEFVECDILNIDGKTPRSFNNFLVKAAATSGSFPGIFPPRLIRFRHPEEDHIREEYFNDGGVRENLPLQAMIDAGAQEIVAIYCAPIEPGEMDLKEKDTVADKPIPTWSDVAIRAVGLTFAEITRTDVFLGRRLNAGTNQLDDEKGQFGADAVDIIDIAPRHPTLGLTEVEPAKIQATIAYGYMCAYDETRIAKLKMGRRARTLLRDNTDNIYERLALIADYRIDLILTAVYRNPDVGGQKWGMIDKWLEERSKRVTEMAFQRHALRVYSMAKKELLVYLGERVSVYGRESLPFSMHGEFQFLKREFYENWTTFQYDSETVRRVLKPRHHDLSDDVRKIMDGMPFFSRALLRTEDSLQKHEREHDGITSWKHRKSLQGTLNSVRFLDDD